MARFLFGIARGPRAAYVATLHPTWVNGQPGRLMLDPAGRTVGVLTIDIAAQRLTAHSGWGTPTRRGTRQAADFRGDGHGAQAQADRAGLVDIQSIGLRHDQEGPRSERGTLSTFGL